MRVTEHGGCLLQGKQGLRAEAQRVPNDLGARGEQPPLQRRTEPHRSESAAFLLHRGEPQRSAGRARREGLRAAGSPGEPPPFRDRLRPRKPRAPAPSPNHLPRPLSAASPHGTVPTMAGSSEPSGSLEVTSTARLRPPAASRQGTAEGRGAPRRAGEWGLQSRVAPSCIVVAGVELQVPECLGARTPRPLHAIGAVFPASRPSGPFINPVRPRQGAMSGSESCACAPEGVWLWRCWLLGLRMRQTEETQAEPPVRMRARGGVHTGCRGRKGTSCVARIRGCCACAGSGAAVVARQRCSRNGVRRRAGFPPSPQALPSARCC